MTGAVRHGEQRATRLVFFVAGFAMAAWAPLVPFAQARAAISDGTLGLLLLCLGVGSIVTMSLAGLLAARFGCRCVIVVSAAPLCLALPLLATVTTPVQLAAALLVLGASLGSIDVVMNLQAVIVERESGRSMMSGFHALFSVGGIAGAGGVTLALGAGMSTFGAVLPVIAGIGAAVAVAYPHLLATASAGGGMVFAMPHRIVWFIGILCFIAFLVEGAMLDWSAIFLATVHGVAPEYAGIGYALFSLTMAVGRLTGDGLVQRFGGRSVIVLGGVCATVGLLLVLAAPWLWTLPGFALIGLGCANIVPVLYTTVGRQTAMPEHLAIAAVTTLGYAGILAGPAMIGFAAQLAGLPMAFLLLAGLQLAVAVAGGFVGQRR